MLPVKFDCLPGQKVNRDSVARKRIECKNIKRRRVIVSKGQPGVAGNNVSRCGAFAQIRKQRAGKIDHLGVQLVKTELIPWFSISRKCSCTEPHNPNSFRAVEAFPQYDTNPGFGAVIGSGMTAQRKLNVL